MNKLILSLVLFFVITTQAFAASLLFKKTGAIDTFQWAPPQYTTGFKYDIYYYIPANLKLNEKNKVIIFMHGGGSSTLTRAGSSTVVLNYLKDLVKLADSQKAILVMPSSSGLNWGGHTRGFIREVAKLIRTQLNVDTNRMTLAGHSMGGMGITRNSFFLSDLFNVMMPIAAGTDPVYLTEENMLTRFNGPYHHVQGLKDHFDVFVTRTRDEVKFMKALEVKKGKPSFYHATFTEDAHNYNLTTINYLMTAHFSKPRNLFQPNLYGAFYYNKTIITDNGIKYDVIPTTEYFWLEVTQFLASTTPVKTAFETSILNNQINITIKNPKHNLAVLRVYLSNQMVKMDQNITIKVNGVTKFFGLVPHTVQTMTKVLITKKDMGFLFDNFVDIRI